MKNAKNLFGMFLVSLTLFTGCSSDDSTPTPIDPVEQTGKILFEATIGNSNDYHLFVMNTDGSNGTQLTNFSNTNGVYTGDASWNFDGSKIIFQTNKDNDGGSGIYVMNADGSNVTRINHNLGRQEQNPQFSPDGNKILFEATIDDSHNYHLFIMNTDGSNEIQLTNFTNGSNYVYTGDASWSPDGSKIVFQTNKDTDGGSSIYTMNSDGSNITRINHNFIGEGEQNPKFSPNGNKILFETSIGDNSHIFVMNTNGSNETQLTNFTSGNEYTYTGDASWNPDGSKIVFQSNKDTDGGSGIYIMNADGSNVTRINHNLGRGEQNPVWK